MGEEAMRVVEDVVAGEEIDEASSEARNPAGE